MAHRVVSAQQDCHTVGRMLARGSYKIPGQRAENWGIDFQGINFSFLLRMREYSDRKESESRNHWASRLCRSLLWKGSAFPADPKLLIPS